MSRQEPRRSVHATLRQLQVFHLFAQTLSVTETARLMHVSQPAVSQVLKELEGQLGFTIFVRVDGQAGLTDEALQLLPYVEQVLDYMTFLRGRAADLRDGRANSLSISVTNGMQTLGASILPRAIALLIARRPEVRINVNFHADFEIARQVRTEHADLGLSSLPMDSKGVVIEPLLRTAMICIMPRGHPLSNEKLITPRHVENQVVITHGRHVPQGFGEDNCTRHRALTTNQSVAALHMVRQGLGLAICCPMTLASDLANDLVALPCEPTISTTLLLTRSRYRSVSRVMSDFVSRIKQALSEFADELAARNLPHEVLFKPPPAASAVARSASSTARSRHVRMQTT